MSILPDLKWNMDTSMTNGTETVWKTAWQTPEFHKGSSGYAKTIPAHTHTHTLMQSEFSLQDY